MSALLWLRRLLWVSFLLVLIFIGTCIYKYLETNNLFMFATGTREKAFLDTTWRMSPHEIERATGFPLWRAEAEDERVAKIVRNLYGPHILNQNRFHEMRQKDLELWGLYSEISYSFFDNQLYEYLITIQSGSALKDVHQTILTSLEKRFGVTSNVKDKDDKNVLYTYTWKSSWETATYSLRHEGENAYRATIGVTYSPLSTAIEQIAKDEEQRYF